MDVLSFVADVAEARPEFFAVEEGRVHEDGDDAGEGEAVAKGEGGGQEKQLVRLVLCFVEG